MHHVRLIADVLGHCDHFALLPIHRKFEDDAGRRLLLRVFDLLGDDPRVNQYRRRMTSLLY